MSAPPPQTNGPKTGLFEGVTFYHWLVVIIASFGWLFDCMDQAIFSLARQSALTELLVGKGDAVAFGTYATTTMLLGWATGGIIFGVLSDRWGRVKTMITTLMIYSGFTGLSGMAQTHVDFLIYRFLVGLGVGGMFGAATTLVAESVPGGFRALALGSLQALSATGNVMGGLLAANLFQPGAQDVWMGLSGWRLLFFVGVLPALLVIPIIIFLREPEAWKAAKRAAAEGTDKRKIGSLSDLFGHPRWRHHAIIGLCLGVSGMVGLWGIAFFSPELVTTALKDKPIEAADLTNSVAFCQSASQPADERVSLIAGRLDADLRASMQSAASQSSVPEELKQSLLDELNRLIAGPSLFDEAVFTEEAIGKTTFGLAARLEEHPNEADTIFLNRQLLETVFPGVLVGIQSRIDTIRSNGFVWQQVGAFLGMLAFTFAASYFSRRAAFFGAFLLCLATVAFVFLSLDGPEDVNWMLGLMGFATLSVFAGYSIYFPELFPTRLRGTGVGFCYNTVRYLAAPFPMLLGILSTMMNFRTAAMLMTLIYVVGMVALIWAPETKGKPLPEDEPAAA
jgi:MFS family permease